MAEPSLYDRATAARLRTVADAVADLAAGNRPQPELDLPDVVEWLRTLADATTRRLVVGDRPILYEEGADPLVWSNTAHGDKRLTWAELAAHQEEELRRARALATVLSDLDRCEHGRHEGDDCSGCGGPSTGNPLVAFADTKLFTHGPWEGRPPLRTIGFDLAGNPIVVPDPAQRQALNDPDNWRTR